MVWGLGISVVFLGFFPFFTGEVLLEASTGTNLRQVTPPHLRFRAKMQQLERFYGS